MSWHDTRPYAFCPRCGAALHSRVLKPGEPERSTCPACEFVHYLDPKLAAGVVVEIDGKILLLKRGIEPAYGTWVFPGGFVDRGEHPEQAAVREAREEAGIEVNLEGLVGIYSLPPGSPVVLIVYHGVITAGIPRALDETLEAATFSPADVPWKDLAFLTTRNAVRDYLSARNLDVPESL